ncbi:MAG: hypothetical protein MJD61_13470 [Proteobacteria bacterium]|nr:hypothetical protein [Pseudomonadota bacterium]
MADLRLTRIDKLIRRDHHHLEVEDECYFMRQYTSGVGYRHSDTNNLISNLKKSIDRRGSSEWRYKERALDRVAAELAESINPASIESATLVPMPPSKNTSDPLHDDRMLQVLQRIQGQRRLDIRELIHQRTSTTAAHASTEPRDPVLIAANYIIDESVATPEPRQVALFDDIITTGAHYRAAHMVLGRRFPGASIIGVFVARRVFPTEREE